MIERHERDDYLVVVKSRAPPPKAFRWKIFRAGNALPIKASSIYSTPWQLAAELGVRIDQHSDHGGCRHQLVQQLKTFRTQLAVDHAHARDIAARPVEARNDAETDRVVADEKYDRYRGGRRLKHRLFDIGQKQTHAPQQATLPDQRA